ncbi:hypothetical protein [Streptomyces sp. NPDC059916]|uniref:hypothetical protein n=1 Tax=Streptomyces sp. NPDC059916 TaxID=3347001 RepID=UPI0036874875
MNTTTAALQAHVTTDTIRAWCRRGVITATKTAGRWTINATSLARRIAIGAMRARKQASMALDLTATYTAVLIPGEAPTTITPTIKRRQTPHAGNIIKVAGIVPLLADQIDSIPDHGDRLHAITVLNAATIVIAEAHDTDWDDAPNARHGGQLRTTYQGGIPQITVDDILDLADQLRTQLTKGA